MEGLDAWSERNAREGSHIDGLIQEIRNSSALALELRLPCTDPSI